MTNPNHLALFLVTILADLEDVDPKEKQNLDRARESAKTTNEDTTK